MYGDEVQRRQVSAQQAEATPHMAAAWKIMVKPQHLRLSKTFALPAYAVVYDKHPGPISEARASHTACRSAGPRGSGCGSNAHVEETRSREKVSSLVSLVVVTRRAQRSKRERDEFTRRDSAARF